MTRLSRPERKQQGDAAEARFRAWLDRCVLPHIFVDQAPLTIPQALKGDIKRPDFLIGIPSIGTIAVDVKAKSVYDDTVTIPARPRADARTKGIFRPSGVGSILRADHPSTGVKIACRFT